jgi:hypothetical protein
MARKDRVPNPPKRPQAPQRRHTQTDPAVAARRRRNLLIGLGAAALIGAAIVLGAIFVSGASADEREVLEGAGCTLQTFPGQEGIHVTDFNAVPKPKWNSSPPTSGTHHVSAAIWGFYTSPVRLIQSVHNLEHGGVVVHYGSEVSDAQIDRLRAWYDEDPRGLVVSPLPSLRPRDSFALAAWTAPSNERGRGYLAKCPTFDEDAFDAFVDEHRFQGPERFDPDALQPGH